MYGATLGSLIGLLLFYGGLAASIGLCLVAIELVDSKRFRKSSRTWAIGSMVCSAISGIAFLGLLSSNVVSKGHGAALGWLVLIPLFLSALIVGPWSRNRK